MHGPKTKKQKKNNTTNFILGSIMRPHSKTMIMTSISLFVEGYTQIYTIIEINKKNEFKCSV